MEPKSVNLSPDPWVKPVKAISCCNGFVSAFLSEEVEEDWWPVNSAPPSNPQIQRQVQSKEIYLLYLWDPDPVKMVLDFANLHTNSSSWNKIRHFFPGFSNPLPPGQQGQQMMVVPWNPSVIIPGTHCREAGGASTQNAQPRPTLIWTSPTHNPLQLYFPLPSLLGPAWVFVAIKLRLTLITPYFVEQCLPRWILSYKQLLTPGQGRGWPGSWADK